MKPTGCSLGSRGRPPGGLLEAVLKPPWGRFGSSWGPPARLLGPPGAPLGRKARMFARVPLGPLWGA
eukprot:1840299-Pyramimonas_sp.AAC.1